MKTISLFTGIGSFEKALKNLNISHELICFSEVDKVAIDSYCKIHNVAESLNLGDITKIDETKLPKDIDLITYGFPCQDLSLGGKLKGLFDKDGKQTRSGLFFDALRIIGEVKPKIAIAENVKNLTATRFADQFYLILTLLEEAGYNNYWQILNAKDFGIPQRRERVFIVSIRKDVDTGLFKFPKGYPLNVELKDFTEANVSDEYYVDYEQIEILEHKGDYFTVREATKKGYAEAYEGDTINLERPTSTTRRGRVGHKVAQTLHTSPQQCVVERKNGELVLRKITPKECFRLMGFDDEDYAKISSTSTQQLYKQAGNSIVVNIPEHIFKCLKASIPKAFQNIEEERNVNMEIKINKMKIRNFMGIRELDLDFNGKDAAIYGDNGTGKTTIKSAFSWVLFDKNTFGKTDFGIKPLDPAGNVIHQLETSVEVELDIDGNVKVFRKTLTEKWTRERGAMEATFSGNKFGYFVNSIPQKKSEYKAMVSSLIDDKVFKSVTDPLFFNEQIDWKERRSILMDICGQISDSEVMATDAALMPLMAVLEDRTVDEHKAMVQARMKDINNELDIIPAKINEAELAKPTSAVVIEEDIKKKDELTAKMMQLQEKRNGIINGDEVRRLKADLEGLKAEYLAPAGEPDFFTETNQIAAIEQSIKNMETLITSNEEKNREDRETLEKYKKEKAILSEEWDSISNKVFTDDTCPLCNRLLPEEEIETKRKQFNVLRSNQLDSIEAQLNGIKEKEKEILTHLGLREAKIAELTIDKEVEVAKKEDLQKVVAEGRNKHMENDRMMKAEIKANIDSIETAIFNLKNGTKLEVETINEEIATIQLEISKIDEAIASVKMIERQNERIEELRKQQLELSAAYTKNEKELYLCEQFTKCKVDMLNEKINSHFKLPRFKLFDVQVNGGIAETCETTYNGVPYSDLNNAMKINIGLDVINTLCRKNEVSAPIFIDNAEAVVRLLPTDSQQIKLVVSEEYKELKMKGEE